MKVTVIGTGYVGLVTGVGMADMGNDVYCLDVDQRKIDMLVRGEMPIHEPGLADMVRRNVEAGRLRFGMDARAASLHGRVQFIAVGTPPDEDGSADLQYVLAAATEIGRHMDGYRVVAIKSTVPVGTAATVRRCLVEELAVRGADHPLGVVSNPEFLKEGAAIDDFMRPDRILIGSDDARATEVMRQLYAPFGRNHSKLMITDVASSELTKYAANAMLATRISFMNEMAALAERLGADIDAVRLGIGSDRRIGSHFLYAGCGYGGSCFPKDVKALLKTGEESGVQMSVLSAVEAANEHQKLVLVEKIVRRFGADLAGLVFAIWGLAFKPGTDDMREAPSLVVIRELISRGARIRAYDPVATREARHALGDLVGIAYLSRASEALEGADALVIITEWKEFRSPDLDSMKAVMRQAIVFDGRNILEPATLRSAGFEYSSIGRVDEVKCAP